MSTSSKAHSKMAWLISMLVLFCFFGCVAPEKCISLKNGCSNGGLFDSYKALFTPACNEHDVCYFCGHYFDISKIDCDNRFYVDMKRTCNQNGGWGCTTYAFIYYSATRLFGTPFYTDFMFPICRKKCVEDILIKDHKH
ncbi:conodipine-P2-like [Hydractinia symbiolongicarpus]|uniref:conodipine-P2-like n=1 Tax=Hydractinia symbiolongicarpus TaxID=13093 RepID=UPI00254C7A68|nr:conodipine-P2-like [Hydractinia symbiolongicarpus]